MSAESRDESIVALTSEAENLTERFHDGED